MTRPEAERRHSAYAAAALALAALLTLTGCDPSPRWVIDGSGHDGPKWGLPGPEIRDFVNCVREQDYDPNPDSTRSPDVPVRRVYVDRDSPGHDGDACPTGPTTQE